MKSINHMVCEILFISKLQVKFLDDHVITIFLYLLIIDKKLNQQYVY